MIKMVVYSYISAYKRYNNKNFYFDLNLANKMGKKFKSNIVSPFEDLSDIQKKKSFEKFSNEIIYHF